MKSIRYITVILLLLQLSHLTAQNLPAWQDPDREVVQKNTEVFLNFIAINKNEKGLLPSGHVIAYEQFQLDEAMPVAETVFKWLGESDRLPEFEEFETTMTVTASGTVYTIDKMSGFIQCIEVNGKKLLESGPKPDFWRAPIDNDFGNKMNKRLVFWEDYADNLQQVEMSWSPDSLTFFVRTRYTSPDKKSGVNLSYVFSGNGELGIIQDLVIRPGVSDYPELPAFGMQLALSGSLSNLEYFGRGQKRMQNIPFLLNQCNLHIL